MTINSIRDTDGNDALNGRTVAGFTIYLMTLTASVVSITDQLFEKFGFFEGDLKKRKIAACWLSGCLDVVILNGICKAPIGFSLLYTAAIVIPLASNIRFFSNNASRTPPEAAPRVVIPPQPQPPIPVPISVPQAKDKHKTIFTAAELEDPEGMYQAALLFDKKDVDAEENEELADYYIWKAADRGHVKAQQLRENFFQSAQSFASKNGESFQLLSFYYAFRAAHQGHPMALYQMGLCFKNGERGVEKNIMRALIYFSLAQRHVDAAKQEIANWPVKVNALLKYNIALWLLEKDPEAKTCFWEIVQLLKSAGGHGYSPEEREQGQYLHATIRLFNLGSKLMRTDHARALRCFELASSIGYGLATYHIGFIFERGLGVAVNLHYALKKYHLAGAIGYQEGRTAYARLAAVHNISLNDPIPKIEIPEIVDESSDVE